MESDDLEGCSLEFDRPEHLTSDDDVAALVLFADVDWTDPAEVERRRHEWSEVLG